MFAVLRLDVAVSIWNRGTREVSMCGFSIGLTLLHGARFRFLPCSLCSLFWLCSLSLSLSRERDRPESSARGRAQRKFYLRFPYLPLSMSIARHILPIAHCALMMSFAFAASCPISSLLPSPTPAAARRGRPGARRRSPGRRWRRGAPGRSASGAPLRRSG